MKYGTVGKVLAVLGALVMVRALTMSVVGGTVAGIEVANIHLMNERSTLMMLGGFLLIAGVVLYGVSKLKQTPDDERRQIQARQAAIASLGDTAAAAASRTLSSSSSVLSRIVGHFRAAPDAPLNRTATGLYVGVCSAFVLVSLVDLGLDIIFKIRTSAFLEVAFLAIVVLTVWHSFTASPGYRRIRNLHLLNVAILSLVPVGCIAVWLLKDGADLRVLSLGLTGILPILVSLVWIYLSRPGKIY